MAAVPGDSEEQFRLRMRAAREEAKMTQAQLSLLLAQRGIEIDPSGVARIERGERSPRLNEAIAVAEVLAIPLGDAIDPANVMPAALNPARASQRLGELQEALQKVEAEIAELRSRAAVNQAQLLARQQARAALIAELRQLLAYAKALEERQ